MNDRPGRVLLVLAVGAAFVGIWLGATIFAAIS